MLVGKGYYTKSKNWRANQASSPNNLVEPTRALSLQEAVHIVVFSIAYILYSIIGQSTTKGCAAQPLQPSHRSACSHKSHE
jgi:hypothetical protein